MWLTSWCVYRIQGDKLSIWRNEDTVRDHESTSEYSIRMQFNTDEGWLCCGATTVFLHNSGAVYAHVLISDKTDVQTVVAHAVSAFERSWEKTTVKTRRSKA